MQGDREGGIELQGKVEGRPVGRIGEEAGRQAGMDAVRVEGRQRRSEARMGRETRT